MPVSSLSLSINESHGRPAWLSVWCEKKPLFFPTKFTVQCLSELLTLTNPVFFVSQAIRSLSEHFATFSARKLLQFQVHPHMILSTGKTVEGVLAAFAGECLVQPASARVPREAAL